MNWKQRIKNKVTSRFFLALVTFLVLVAVASAITIPLVSNKNGSSHKNKYHIVLQLKNGFQDKGFEQQAVEGLCLAFKIQPKDCNFNNKLFKEGKISYAYRGDSGTVSDIKKHIDNFVDLDQKNFFVMSGWVFEEFLEKWVFEDREYFQKRGINFIGIGTTLAPKDGKNWPKNFWQVLFEEYLPGYYAGLYAAAYALMNPDQFKDADDDTDGKQIYFGALGGDWVPAIARFALGFKLGISVINQKRNEFTNTDTQVLFTKYQTNGGWGDTLEEKQNAQTKVKNMFVEGVSVVFSIAATLTSTLQTIAQEENTRTGKNQHWVVGVDVDQGIVINDEDQQSSTRKGSILVSALKKSREKLADLIKDIDQEEKATGKLINVTQNKYLSIPQRFKNDDEWKRVETVILNQEIEPAKKVMQTMRQWVAKGLEKPFKTKLQTFLNDSTRTDFLNDALAIATDSETKETD